MADEDRTGVSDHPDGCYVDYFARLGYTPPAGHWPVLIFVLAAVLFFTSLAGCVPSGFGLPVVITASDIGLFVSFLTAAPSDFVGFVTLLLPLAVDSAARVWCRIGIYFVSTDISNANTPNLLSVAAESYPHLHPHLHPPLPELHHHEQLPYLA